jgi:hypothetical protein
MFLDDFQKRVNPIGQEPLKGDMIDFRVSGQSKPATKGRN